MAQSRAAENNEVTTTADLMGGRQEIVVDPIVEVPEQPGQGNRVLIRMNTTLDDFTYGNPNVHYKLEAGKRYMMPRHIASYLDDLGYVWH